MKPQKQAKKARIYRTGSWLFKHEHMAQLLASTRHLPCLSLFVPWGSFIPSTKRETVFKARCVNSLPSFQQYLNCGYLNDSLISSGSVMKPSVSLTSSSSCVSTAGPLWASWKRSFFILRYCRLSSSLTASFVLWIRSINTVSGRSRRTNMCCRTHRQVSGLSCLQCTCCEDTLMSSSWVYQPSSLHRRTPSQLTLALFSDFAIQIDFRMIVPKNKGVKTQKWHFTCLL